MPAGTIAVGPKLPIRDVRYPVATRVSRTSAARFNLDREWPIAGIVDSSEYCWHRIPFRNAQIHDVIMFFVSNGRRSPEPRRRQCDDAISNKGVIDIRS
jgi:hypothetical protein